MRTADDIGCRCALNSLPDSAIPQHCSTWQVLWACAAPQAWRAGCLWVACDGAGSIPSRRSLNSTFLLAPGLWSYRCSILHVDVFCVRILVRCVGRHWFAACGGGAIECTMLLFLKRYLIAAAVACHGQPRDGPIEVGVVAPTLLLVCIGNVIMK